MRDRQAAALTHGDATLVASTPMVSSRRGRPRPGRARGGGGREGLPVVSSAPQGAACSMSSDGKPAKGGLHSLRVSGSLASFHAAETLKHASGCCRAKHEACGARDPWPLLPPCGWRKHGTLRH